MGEGLDQNNYDCLVHLTRKMLIIMEDSDTLPEMKCCSPMVHRHFKLGKDAPIPVLCIYKSCTCNFHPTKRNVINVRQSVYFVDFHGVNLSSHLKLIMVLAL